MQRVLTAAIGQRVPSTWLRQALGDGFWLSAPSTSASSRPASSDAAAAGQQQQEVICLRGSRAVLRVHGPQALQFLQGMVTNDMRPLEQPGCPPVYAALLTPKGKLLHDIIVYREGSQAPCDAVLLDVDAHGADSAAALLKRYTLKRKVAVDNVSADHSVWVAFGGPSSTDSPGPQPSVPQGLTGEWQPDPRLPALGWRGVFSGNAASEAGASASAGTDAYVRWRALHGVAEGSVEMPTEESVPLEYSLDALHGISYKKGCYVGQERVSFGHYRGIIRRRCLPFLVAGPGAEGVRLPAETPVSVQGTGESVGLVRSCVGGTGLAVLKLQPALQAAAGKVQLVAGPAGGAQVKVMPFKPSWWSPEWGNEEGQQ